jgi:hypothetical protein
MKDLENQELRSSGVITLLGLVGLSALIIATPWNRSLTGQGSEEALQKAEVVGYQVVQIYREAAKNREAITAPAKARGPASVQASGDDLSSLIRTTGTMGSDPWGQPYHFRILSSNSAKIRILVWSAGPNGKVETPKLDDENAQPSFQPAYSGDDVGLVLSVSQN